MIHFTNSELDTLLQALTVMCGTPGEDFHSANALHTKILMNREELTGQDPGTRIGFCNVPIHEFKESVEKDVK